jgi:large-conductance mechanosensitive channel
MKSVLAEFREFVLRGTLVDLAIAVVLGAAFGALVTSFVTNLVTPLIAAIRRRPREVVPISMGGSQSIDMRIRGRVWSGFM